MPPRSLQPPDRFMRTIFTYPQVLFGKQKAVAKTLWTMPCTLLNLSTTPDEELKKYVCFGAAALVAKHIHYLKDPHSQELLIYLLQDLPELEARMGWDYIRAMLTYMAEAGNMSDKKVFTQGIKATFAEKRAMNLLEQFEQDGYEKGKKEAMSLAMKLIEERKLEGKTEALQEMALKLIAHGFSVEKASSLTGLSVDAVCKLQTKSQL